MKNVKLFLSHEALREYISSDNKKYDLLFYIIFIIQVSILISMPVGKKIPTSQDWAGYAISSIFDLVFYSIFYFIFYFRKKSDFIKEIVVFSVVARLHSFLYICILAIIQMFLWTLLRLEKLADASMIYYIFYILLFTILMVRIKKRTFN